MSSLARAPAENSTKALAKTWSQVPITTADRAPIMMDKKAPVSDLNQASTNFFELVSGAVKSPANRKTPTLAKIQASMGAREVAIVQPKIP